MSWREKALARLGKQQGRAPAEVTVVVASNVTATSSHLRSGVINVGPNSPGFISYCGNEPYFVIENANTGHTGYVCMC